MIRISAGLFLVALTTLMTELTLIRVFDVIYIMTFGGPGHATELLPFFIYRSAFSASRMGFASAVSWITLAITIILLIPLFMGERSGAESERIRR